MRALGSCLASRSASYTQRTADWIQWRRNNHYFYSNTEAKVEFWGVILKVTNISNVLRIYYT
jgi:hypothetical protein